MTEARNREFRSRLLINELEHACAEGARQVRRWSLRENGMQPSEVQMAHGAAAALLRCMAANRVALAEIGDDAADVCRELADLFDASGLGRRVAEHGAEG
jgi:hypothetical protein